MIDKADRLLLLLARGTLTPEAESQARELLDQNISWSALLERARMQEVLPLVYHNLRTLGFAGVPPEIRREFADLHRKNAIRNAVLQRELAMVLRLFERSAIPVIPLKGPTFAQALYGDSTLRMCQDIDLLVPRGFVTEALRLLAERGYTGRCEQPLIAELALRYGTEQTLVREAPQATYLVDLHWGMFVGTSVENAALAELWSEARPASYCGVQAARMTPEWQLLFLATHAARHRWQRLKWLADIHEICTRAAIDWEKLKSMAIRLGWDRIVELGLSASHELYGTPIPSGWSRTPMPSWLRLFPAEDRAEAPGTAFMLRLLARPAERLRYLTVVLLVPTADDARVLRLPPVLGYFYYPFRPLRLMAKCGWQVVCILFRCLSAVLPDAARRTSRASS